MSKKSKSTYYYVGSRYGRLPWANLKMTLGEVSTYSYSIHVGKDTPTIAQTQSRLCLVGEWLKAPCQASTAGSKTRVRFRLFLDYLGTTYTSIVTYLPT